MGSATLRRPHVERSSRDIPTFEPAPFHPTIPTVFSRVVIICDTAELYMLKPSPLVTDRSRLP